MEANLLEGLKLMGIGMTTVFAVLLIIIFFGKALIWFVNRFVPEEEKAPQVASNNAQTVDPRVAQAIRLAIQQITGGKSTAEKIEKI